MVGYGGLFSDALVGAGGWLVEGDGLLDLVVGDRPLGLGGGCCGSTVLGLGVG